MKVKNFTVATCDIKDIRDFIEHWHYSGNVNGVKSKYCFMLKNGNNLIGAAIFAEMGMANVWKKYADSRTELIELRRLCCIDDTPKNTESYFIGHCLRWLRRNTDVKKVISYADMDFGHRGIIYQATNFTYLGMTKKGKVIIFNGKRYHDKTIRTYHNGKLKPYAVKIAEALKTGQAFYQETKGKHIYLYKLVS